MALLDEILGLAGPAQPAVDPQQLAALQRRMVGMTEPAPQPMPRPAPVQATPPDFGGGLEGSDVLGAILQGMGGIAAPLGNLVANQGAKSRQNAQKTEIYNWLLTQKDPNDAARTITPDMAKIIVTNESIAKEYLPRILGTSKSVDAVTKGAPNGYMWNDPANPGAGVKPMPGFEQKPDPVETAMRKEEFKADNKRLGDIRKEGDIGRETIDKLAQLRQAREGVSYEGGFFPNARTFLGKNLPDVLPFGGLPFIPSQDEAGKAEQVGSLATDIQLQFTQKTKGAISNREMELFGSATPGMAMSDSGAKGVIDGMEAGSLRMREKPKFYDAWRKANGSLDGADEAWDSFIEAKPILQPDKKGGFKVDRNNVGAWREFVGGGGQVSGPGGQGSAPAGIEGARQAPDGNYYVADPNRPGKYLRVMP